MSLEAHKKLATWKGLPLRLRGLGCLLADCHNAESDLCCPSLEWLAEHGATTDRAIRRTLRELEEFGVISVEPRFREGRQTTSEYLILENPENALKMGGDKNVRGEGDKNGLGGTLASPTGGTFLSPGTRKKESGNIPLYPHPKNPTVFSLPPEVDRVVWEKFEAHRIELHNVDKKRNPLLTDFTRTEAANILRELSLSDQRACVQASIVSGWKGLFPKSKHENEPTRARLMPL